MSKLSQLTDQQIYTAIEAMQNGIAIKPNSEESKALEVSISRAYAELERRAQKKTEEPTGKTGQSDQQSRIRPELNPSLGIPSLNETPEKLAADKRLPTKEELQAWERGMENYNQNQHHNQAESAKAFEVNRVVIAKIENPEPMTIPVVEMEFKDRDGNTYNRALDQADILSLLKTYFKRVAVSPKMSAKRYSEAYGSDMGKMVYKLFQGWNTIYNETQEGAAWPPLDDCFPGMGRATLEQKVNAQVLWRWASNNK